MNKQEILKKLSDIQNQVSDITEIVIANLSDDSGEEQPKPKKRGRPKGSANKSTKTIEVAEDEQVPSSRAKARRTNRKKAVGSYDEAGNPNLFFSIQFNNSEKRNLDKDRKIDEKLWSNVEPSERRGVLSSVEVTCSRCGKTEMIPPKSVPRDETRYRCNECFRPG